MRADIHQANILSERLLLRPVTEEDVEGSYYRWMNDPEIIKYMESRFSDNTKENMLSFVRVMSDSDNDIFRAITIANKHIGNIRLGPINWHHKSAPIGLVIGEKEFWGHGIGCEAIEAITQFAFRSLKLNKVFASCYSANIGSAAAFQKVGFTIEGILKKQVSCDGKFIDVVVMGRTKF
jgi:[ribosomal protein S5]-alanine N-acetyltransferase